MNEKEFPQIDERLLKPYNPAETEGRIYAIWEEIGFFNPDICIEKGVTKEDAKPFTIIMPPPNVTGVLHMGHALMLTLEDIMIRYHRMKGDRTLWIPGTDHAAIATQSKVEKEIQKKEGKSRHDLGREELLRRVREFAQESHDTITSQVRAIGSSCDWSREAFTLDETRTKAVYTMFKKMHEDGLIYRGHRIVNWDPKGQTTIADDEIVYEERKSKLYTFKYSHDFPISISTTRPETKIGDTAVAVHPDDPRYKEYIGKTYGVRDFCGVPLEIKIIADESVEKDFGTGALGVTPSHSMIDWEIADRHDLPRPQVINEYAKMMIGDERILGKKTTDAREIIVEWLRSEGLLEKEEEANQNISTAERTGGIIEPLPKLQWFIDVNKSFTLPHSEIKGIESGSQTTLKEIMKKVVENGQTAIIPEHFNKTYFHWIENLRDWCISRQIWYGHRIPVWYKDKEIHVGVETPEGEGWIQDEDTLDTWFSSGLWTFSTLGWPEKTKDLEIYHPTNVLQTGYDILFFWVARMVLMTGYALGTVPFHTVYLSGLVRDAKGQKMSKSLGNALDPVEIAQKYGADAGRIALIIGNTPGTDMRISEDKIKGYKHFANKLWNITRFVLSSIDGIEIPASADGSQKPKITDKDQKLIDRLEELTKEITGDIEEFRFHLAGEKLYHYSWSEFADIILEESKEVFKTGTEEEKTSRAWTLKKILKTNIIMLHPFMPFVTEEIWSMIKNENDNLLIATKWPTQ
ncbi:MAG: valine--tRNA ligase [Candidatus Paceibacterota bacterium]|jgi:valyl-tRNA synthetase